MTTTHFYVKVGHNAGMQINAGQLENMLLGLSYSGRVAGADSVPHTSVFLSYLPRRGEMFLKSYDQSSFFISDLIW